MYPHSFEPHDSIKWHIVHVLSGRADDPNSRDILLTRPFEPI